MTLTVWSIDGAIPVVDPSAYVHPTAVLIGDVIVGPGCYIGPAACLRGDFGRLDIRAGSNVQDSCILHAYPGNETVVEEDGHIGPAPSSRLHGRAQRSWDECGSATTPWSAITIVAAGVRESRHDRPAPDAGRGRAGTRAAPVDRR
jgi:hypothetical protein